MMQDKEKSVLVQCLLLIVSDKWLQKDMLPVDSCSDSHTVYSEEERKYISKWRAG